MDANDIKSKVSLAQRKATAKYLKEKCDEIKVRVPKGKKDVIAEHAQAKGETLNGFINRAIDETIKRDGE